MRFPSVRGSGRSRASVKKALFASLSGIDPGVFDSQVLDYGLFLRSLGIDFRYLLFEGFRTWLGSRNQVEKTLRDFRRQYEVEIEMRYLLRPLSASGLRRAASRIAERARGLVRDSDRVLIQARGLPAAWAALEAKRRLSSAVVLYDARDDPAAEARMEARRQDRLSDRRRWEGRARLLESLEARVCRESDHVLAVSGPLRERIRALGNLPASSVTVVPCCLDPGRFTDSMAWRGEMRERLGLADRLVLVYSGSMSVWQVPGRVASLVEEVRKQLPRVFLLLLTKDTGEAEKFFGRLRGEGSCRLVSCGYGEVGRYLAAADVALLLREEDPVNRVACPVKFAEYQACGLPVILTPGIGEVSDYVLRTGYGRVVRLDEPMYRQAAVIAEFLRGESWPMLRDEIRRKALSFYSRESYAGAYRQVLARLGVEPDRSEPGGAVFPNGIGPVPSCVG